MTQENKYSRINELAEELIAECDKQDATIISLISMENDVVCGVRGNVKDIGMNLVMLEQTIESKTDMPIEKVKVAGALRLLEQGSSNPLSNLFESLSEIAKEFTSNGNENQ